MSQSSTNPNNRDNFNQELSLPVASSTPTEQLQKEVEGTLKLLVAEAGIDSSLVVRIARELNESRTQCSSIQSQLTQQVAFNNQLRDAASNSNVTELQVQLAQAIQTNNELRYRSNDLQARYNRACFEIARLRTQLAVIIPNKTASPTLGGNASRQNSEDGRARVQWLEPELEQSHPREVHARTPYTAIHTPNTPGIEQTLMHRLNTASTSASQHRPSSQSLPPSQRNMPPSLRPIPYQQGQGRLSQGLQQSPPFHNSQQVDPHVTHSRQHPHERPTTTVENSTQNMLLQDRTYPQPFVSQLMQLSSNGSPGDRQYAPGQQQQQQQQHPRSQQQMQQQYMHMQLHMQRQQQRFPDAHAQLSESQQQSSQPRAQVQTPSRLLPSRGIQQVQSHQMIAPRSLRIDTSQSPISSTSMGPYRSPQHPTSADSEVQSHRSTYTGRIRNIDSPTLTSPAVPSESPSTREVVGFIRHPRVLDATSPPVDVEQRAQNVVREVIDLTVDDPPSITQGPPLKRRKTESHEDSNKVAQALLYDESTLGRVSPKGSVRDEQDSTAPANAPSQPINHIINTDQVPNPSNNSQADKLPDDAAQDHSTGTPESLVWDNPEIAEVLEQTFVSLGGDLPGKSCAFCSMRHEDDPAAWPTVTVLDNPTREDMASHFQEIHGQVWNALINGSNEGLEDG